MSIIRRVLLMHSKKSPVTFYYFRNWGVKWVVCPDAMKSIIFYHSFIIHPSDSIESQRECDLEEKGGIVITLYQLGDRSNLVSY